jgi:anti-sigma28 factor (negative regulator of flagellin synthesis)
MRMDTVTRLRTEIEAGRYRVEPLAVADAILAFFARTPQ